MNKTMIRLTIDPQILEATTQFMDEKGLELSAELNETVWKLYRRHVPLAVRKYLERTQKTAAPPAQKPPIETGENTQNRAEFTANPEIQAEKL